MVIFPFKQYKYLVKELAVLPGRKLGKFLIGRFPNQEIYLKLLTNVELKECLIVGSISPPDEQLISFLFLAHTLKKELASNIIALLPYLAYARQDKVKKGENLAITTIGELLRMSHVSKVVTIDVHSQQTESLFPLPLESLSPAKLFAQQIKKLKLKRPTFLAPDQGAIPRTLAVTRQLNIKSPIAYMEKTRGMSGIVNSTLVGDVGKEVIIIDDILDTGGTLLACCEILKKVGVKKIFIFVTHGQFSGNKWQHLFDLNVERIYCTDSIPQVRNLNQKKIRVLSIAPILKEYASLLKKSQRQVKKFLKKVAKEEPELLLTE